MSLVTRNAVPRKAAKTTVVTRVIPGAARSRNRTSPALTSASADTWDSEPIPLSTARSTE